MTRNAVQDLVPANLAILGAIITFVITLGGCQSMNQSPPIRTEEYVDLERFAGDWYVIASIPTFIEKDAYDAVETYAAPKNGQVETTFSFSKGGFDGTRKVYRPTGFVLQDGSNAVWGMQFIWPFKAEYRVVLIDEEYQQTIIGRSARDYVWIMARSPQISDSDYAEHLELLTAEGYDISKVRKVPHKDAVGSPQSSDTRIDRQPDPAESALGIVRGFPDS